MSRKKGSLGKIVLEFAVQPFPSMRIYTRIYSSIQFYTVFARLCKRFDTLTVKNRQSSEFNGKHSQNNEITPKLSLFHTGLAVNTLYDKTYQRAILHYKKGKRVYCRVSKLVAWIAGGRVSTAAMIEAKAVTHGLNNPTSPWGNRKSARASGPTTTARGRMAIAMRKPRTQRISKHGYGLKQQMRDLIASIEVANGIARRPS